VKDGSLYGLLHFRGRRPAAGDPHRTPDRRSGGVQTGGRLPSPAPTAAWTVPCVLLRPERPSSPGIGEDSRDLNDQLSRWFRRSRGIQRCAGRPRLPGHVSLTVLCCGKKKKPPRGKGGDLDSKKKEASGRVLPPSDRYGSEVDSVIVIAYLRPNMAGMRRETQTGVCSWGSRACAVPLSPAAG